MESHPMFGIVCPFLAVKFIICRSSSTEPNQFERWKPKKNYENMKRAVGRRHSSISVNHDNNNSGGGGGGGSSTNNKLENRTKKFIVLNLWCADRPADAHMHSQPRQPVMRYSSLPILWVEMRYAKMLVYWTSSGQQRIAHGGSVNSIFLRKLRS